MRIRVRKKEALPNGYMEKIRKEHGMKNELREIKEIAKKLKISYDKNQKPGEVFDELLTRISERTDPEAQKFFSDFQEQRWSILNESIRNPRQLIKWLYEEQGERRFDAANRLFLVLIDKSHLEDSWKMKRNTELLVKSINSYLGKFKAENIKDYELEFNWMDGKKYSTLSDIIFVVKE